MDNVIDQVNQILNNPESMKQIMSIASAIDTDQLSDSTSNLFADGYIKDFSRILEKMQEKDDKRQALVRALLPYLRPGHQRRLERAIQIAKLSHMAGEALKNEQETQIKAVEHDI